MLFLLFRRGEHLFFFRTIVSAFMVEKIVILSFSEKLSFFFFKSTVPLKTAKKGSGTIGDAVRQSAISLS